MPLMTYDDKMHQLQRDAETARKNYAASLDLQKGWAKEYALGSHPAMLILQAVGFEIAGGLFAIARAIEAHK